MRADPDGIFVNVGAKAEGVVPPGEMKTLDAEAWAKIIVGDDIVTFVVRTETAEEGAILSIDRAQKKTQFVLLPSTGKPTIFLFGSFHPFFNINPD